MTSMEIGPDDWPKIVRAIEAVGSLDALLALAYAPSTKPPARRRQPWTRAQVIEAYNLKLLTRAEARRLLRIRP